MKRILASLMAIVVGATTATNVVACGQRASLHTIDIKFGSNLKYGDYSESDNSQAYNGGSQSAYQQPLNALLYQVFNLFSLNTAQFTTSKEIKAKRTSFIGMDEDVIKGEETKPSVDGLYFKGVDPVEPNEFYSSYKNTYINSLCGLYQLWSVKDKINSGQIGAAANESLTLATSVFGTEDGYNFIDSFLSLHNQSYNSSWQSAMLDSDTTPVELNSKILSYNIESEGEGEDKVDTYQFAPVDQKTNLGKNVDFVDVNTKIGAETGHDDEKMGNRYKQPFDLLMLPAEDPTTIQDPQFDTNWTYDKDEVDSQKKWAIRKPSDANFNWNIKSTTEFIDENQKQKGFVKTNESIIIPLKPLQVQFAYSTNVKDSNADKYVVKITIAGLQAVFRPLINAALFKDPETDGKTIGNRYAKWLFTHYQFTDQIDTTVSPERNEKNRAGFGNLSGLHISSIDINKTV